MELQRENILSNSRTLLTSHDLRSSSCRRVQSLNNPDELTKCFVWIMEHESEIKEHLEKILPEYKAKAYVGNVALKGL